MGDLKIRLGKEDLGTPRYGDLELSGSGDLQITSGIDAVRQSLILRLSACTQDFFLAMDDGLPFFSGLFQTRGGLSSAFEQLMQNEALQTPGIQGLLNWSSKFTPQSRLLEITLEAQTIDGVVAFSVPILVGGA